MSQQLDLASLMQANFTSSFNRLPAVSKQATLAVNQDQSLNREHWTLHKRLQHLDYREFRHSISIVLRVGPWTTVTSDDGAVVKDVRPRLVLLTVQPMGYGTKDQAAGGSVEAMAKELLREIVVFYTTNNRKYNKQLTWSIGKCIKPNGKLMGDECAVMSYATQDSMREMKHQFASTTLLPCGIQMDYSPLHVIADDVPLKDLQRTCNIDNVELFINQSLGS